MQRLLAQVNEEDLYEVDIELSEEWAEKLLRTVQRRQAKVRRERKAAQKGLNRFFFFKRSLM